MTYEFYVDAEITSKRRIRNWYYNNLLRVLEHAKENQARDIDTSIAMAKELTSILDEPRAKPREVPPHDVTPQDKAEMMKPVEPEVLDILYGSSEKYADQRYLKARNKKSPEDKYYFRVVSSWDYGWQQKSSRVPAKDVHHGRCALLRETFYRKNNPTPDPPTYAQPVGGEFSVCTQYSCYAG
ncbi:protein SPMIP1-like [Cydia pomonella]|uniref:protein SPMIP1-like n=1 Tax=Cydia pomonella TaxID=82600 RepID=UPI002ADE0D7B|nr:protein SPMIP1-like [Cydia pomonella]